MSYTYLYYTLYIFPLATKVGEPRSLYVIDLLANCDYFISKRLKYFSFNLQLYIVEYAARKDVYIQSCGKSWPSSRHMHVDYKSPRQHLFSHFPVRRVRAGKYSLVCRYVHTLYTMTRVNHLRYVRYIVVEIVNKCTSIRTEKRPVVLISHSKHFASHRVKQQRR